MFRAAVQPCQRDNRDSYIVRIAKQLIVRRLVTDFPCPTVRVGNASEQGLARLGSSSIRDAHFTPRQKGERGHHGWTTMEGPPWMEKRFLLLATIYYSPLPTLVPPPIETTKTSRLVPLPSFASCGDGFLISCVIEPFRAGCFPSLFLERHPRGFHHLLRRSIQNATDQSTPCRAGGTTRQHHAGLDLVPRAGFYAVRRVFCRLRIADKY